MASLLFIVMLIKSSQLQDTHELTLHALSYHNFDEAALSPFVLPYSIKHWQICELNFDLPKFSLPKLYFCKFNLM